MILMSNYILIIILLTINPSKYLTPMHAKITLIIFIFITMITLNFMTYNHLMPMIIFLIMIGGLMIIFLYFTSFTEKFSPLKPMDSLFMYMNVTLFLIFMFYSYEMNIYFPWFNNTKRITPINNLYLTSPKNFMDEMTLMYSINKGISMLLILLFLMLSLFIIIKMCKSSGKTMRKMM